MTAPVLDVLIPAVDRPHRVDPLVRSLRLSTPVPMRILFLLDEGFPAELAAVERAGCEADLGGGTYPQKINRGFGLTSAPFVYCGADDLEFRPGWWDAVSRELRRGVAVVGTNDLGNRDVMGGKTATSWVMVRSYIAATGGVIDGPPGQVLHEGYRHNFCDTEFAFTARLRGLFTVALDAHVEHLHPAWGKATNDAVYERGQSRWTQDQALFNSRCELFDGAPLR